jgi:hypothetical protein
MFRTKLEGKFQNILFSNNNKKREIIGEFADSDIIRCMHFAGWISKATDRHLVHVIYCFSATAVFTQTRSQCNVILTLSVLYCLISRVFNR